ncbi:uncharacterized protein LOC122859305 [Aphidius gifuensis]|uniref:uncharacterized protein LOC122859305 n=1 Tax=Aphidius gifuensis TaxID=684658 RepID=UPI001CDD7E16|nr:uncharacterized protein LOC122859305 [Aphidius gifuensis]
MPFCYYNGDMAAKFTPTSVIQKLIHKQKNESMTGFIQLIHCVTPSYYHYHFGYADTFTVQLSNNQEEGLFRITFFGKDAWEWSKKLNINMVITIDGGVILYPEINKSSKKTPEVIFTENSKINIINKEFFKEPNEHGQNGFFWNL